MSIQVSRSPVYLYKVDKTCPKSLGNSALHFFAFLMASERGEERSGEREEGAMFTDLSSYAHAHHNSLEGGLGRQAGRKKREREHKS